MRMEKLLTFPWGIRTLHTSIMLKKNKNLTYYLPRFWLSSLLLIIAAVFGILVSILSRNIFLIWFGLEVNMFRIIPFLRNRAEEQHKMDLKKRSNIKASFFYFFVQVIGRLLFAWGSVMGDAFFVALIGLIIKMGIVPFFWWVPAVITRLDWLSIGVMSTIQKVPGLFLFRILFDIPINLCIFISLIGFAVSAVGINLSYKNFKQLIAWSSISNMRILFALVVINRRLGLVYYIFYSLMILMFCCIIAYSNVNDINQSFLKGNKKIIDTLIGLLLLIFSGLPPFISFFLKVYFLRGLYSLDSVFVLRDLNLKGNAVSYFYMLGSSLKSFSLAIVFLFIMVLQSVGYIKAFINMNRRKEARLLNRSCKTEWTFLTCVSSVGLFMYLFSIFIILF